jgi:chaperonin cofactor prefoldin
MADTALMNQLLQEAANRAVALADQAQEATGSVEDLLERAASLSETLGEQGEQVHQRFQELQAKLDAADDELEERAVRAGDGLQALPAQAESVQGRVDELLGAIKGQLSDLKAREDELSVTLDRHSGAAQADLEQLAGETRALEAAAEARLQEATQELGNLHSAIAQAREDIQASQDELLDAMDALESVAREQVQRFVEGMATTLTAHTTALFELEQRLKDAHNGAVVALRKKFAEEVVSRLPAAAAPLKEALASLGALCGEQELALIEECLQVVERFERVTRSAERSQALLQAADRLAPVEG